MFRMKKTDLVTNLVLGMEQNGNNDTSCIQSSCWHLTDLRTKQDHCLYHALTPQRNSYLI